MSRRAVRVGRVDVLEHDGLLLDVRDSGPRDGDVVVLLHGFPQDSRCWDSVTPHLHRAGLRTLAPDQRGYSPKGSPSEVSEYRIEVLASDVLRLLDEAGLERAHIVGHDWGGALAWHLGAHHAARVATLTVLSTPHPRAFAWSLLRSMQGLRSWYAVAVQIPVLPELVLGATLAPALRLSGLPKETAQRYRARMATPSALRGPLNWCRASARHPLVALPLLAGGDGEDIIHVPTTYSPHRDTLDPGSLTGGGPDRRPRRSRRPGRARRCAPPRSAGVPGRSGACGRRPPSVPAAARPRRTRHRR